MGQYHFIVNLTKKQYLDPADFGDGNKLLEFGSARFGSLFGLSVLLACSNGRGGGDFHGNDPYRLVGSWAGDEIVIVGDYYEVGDLADGENRLPLDWSNSFTRISESVAELIQEYSLKY